MIHHHRYALQTSVRPFLTIYRRSRTMSTTTSSNSSQSLDERNTNWIKELKVSQLKSLLGSKASAGCTEKSELESLLRNKQISQQEAILALQHRDVLDRLQHVLSDDRGVMMYSNYSPSQDHIERMSKLKNELPHIFDNPELTPRIKWLHHHNWSRHSQMPPFHVHFRYEMQDALRYLYTAYCADDNKNKHEKEEKEMSSKEASSSSSTTLLAKTSAQKALRMFRGCMQGLHGHVGIEEYAVFPIFQKRFPKVDIAFLYTDHERLHQAEDEANAVLSQVVSKFDDDNNNNNSASREDMIQAMDALLKFDQELMAHLGEEEEFIVPMTLSTDERIRF